MKKTAALSALLMILSGALARADEAAPAATQKYTQAELDASPYLKSVATREGTKADTSKFKKTAPYKIALAAQGPTNSWAALFDQEARYHVDQLGKGKVSELLYASADGNADKQVPQVEDLLSQNPDALILVPMGRAALAASVDRAATQGVPVVLCASGVDGDSYVTEIGTNLYDLGARAGELAFRPAGRLRKYSRHGRHPRGRHSRNRQVRRGRRVEEQIGHQDFGRAVRPVVDQRSQEDRRAVDRQIRQDHSGHMVRRRAMSQGIVEAFQEAKLPVPPLASADYSNGLLRQVKDGNIKFSAGQYPNAMVILCIDTALKILNGESVSRFIDFRSAMEKTQDVNTSNIDTFFNPKWSDDVFPPIFLPDSKMVELKYMSK